jgi:predicted hotdog family 3-hydroxylacyl-ACP dehydratase
MSSEPTVEGCLSELRVMFPDKPLFIKDDIEWWDDDVEACRATVIKIGVVEADPKFTGDSLSEAMAQVRQWHKEHRPNG